jgi:hypothetical protein
MTVNLGGSEEDESGSQPATSAAVDSGTSTIAPTSVSCAGVSSTTTLSDGTGFNANIPPACSAADGPTQTPTSVAQVAQAVVGTWYDCLGSGPIFTLLGDDIASGSQGIELTKDGHYVVLGTGPADYPILSTASTGAFIPLSVPAPDGGASIPVEGTYQVVDASASLGASAYQISFQPSTGGVYLAQVVMLGSPTKMRLISGAASTTEEFAPALPLTFRAGVCNYTQFGPQAPPFATAAEMLAGIKGTWIWCAGTALQTANAIVGIEFPGDYTFSYLIEDDSGKVTRGTGNNAGTISPGDDGILNLTYGVSGSGTDFQPVLAACESTLGFDWQPYWPSDAGDQVDYQPIFQRTTATF